MSVSGVYRWGEGSLHRREGDDRPGSRLEAVDSWLVTEGSSLALGLHRARFADALRLRSLPLDDGEDFWQAALALIPRQGDWFPRVEARSEGEGTDLLFRLRPAPDRQLNLAVRSHDGDDPRQAPTVKGPDLEALLRLRTAAQTRGTGEVVLLTEAGHIVEGTTSALLWWRGGILCVPAAEFDRVDSVTARSVLALATALGVDVSWEATTPAELDGLEVWAANALHGLRIVTRWVDGPSLAEEPGRLREWRARLDALRRPLPGADRLAG